MADFGFAKFGDDDDNEEDEEYDPQCIQTTMQNKIISSNKDLIGVIFYGTEKIENPNDFKNIYVYMNLEQPGAERILEIEDMVHGGYKKFGTKYGHNESYSISEALWACANMFSNLPQKVNYKRILLFTNNDDPHSSNQQLQRQARTKASDLNETGIDLELMHLQKPGQNFDVSKFWKDLIYTTDDELTELPNPSEKHDELLTRVRTKDHKKRALGRVGFSLGKGINFSVGIYSLVSGCPKPYGIKLDKKTNEELKSHSKTYLKETGEVLMAQDLKKVQTYGGRKICFENDEVVNIKRFDVSGLKLMGFKPRSKLKKYYQVKPGQFIYPDEDSIAGSTTMFTALLKKCLDRDVTPICQYIPRKNNPPKFVALLPQKEELDDHKIQITPPGFHVIILPYADDFRKVKLDDEAPKATTDQIDKAKELIKKLQFQFSSENFENPVLQNHWRNIEAIALDRDAPEEMTDYTMPYKENVQKRAGRIIDDFKDLVFPADYVPVAKRKAPSSESAAAKKSKVADAVVALDIKKEAQEGRLGKFTVPILKEFIKKEKITANGSKKADLIEAINNQYGIAN
ncbi:X-ray repair cross-complementing protein 5 isoform X2 [Patella vulgata]|uniref:X-ray repair cross-complementing protein 5 isoform X2 n=1 Tax=Patella vulgata TaxID=6465 RepID=UPI00217FCE21|nr:X-ray repair cross-complementing protein 5 isoform X2 [Patella vulgata]